jgi:hypothetical protein
MYSKHLRALPKAIGILTFSCLAPPLLADHSGELEQKDFRALAPSQLAHAVDDDPTTGTTEGITWGKWNEGIFEIDLGAPIIGNVYAKYGIRQVSGRSCTWRMLSSMDGVSWTVIYTIPLWRQYAETPLYPASPFWGQYLRFTVLDHGDGQCGLKLYDFKVLPTLPMITGGRRGPSGFDF